MPDTRIGGSRVGFENPQCARFGKQPKQQCRIAGLLPGRFEQFADRNTQHGRDARQAAGAYPVRALLVFLYLLESNTDLIGEIGLAYSAMNPKDANPAPTMASSGSGILAGIINLPPLLIVAGA